MNTPLCGVEERPPPKTPYVSESTPSDHDTEIKRCPVSKDQIAMYLGQGMPCLTAAHKAFPEVLYESVHKLVRKLAIQYSVTCRDDKEDLMQDCWCRIIFKLHLFKAHKGNFTTWCWRVCTSVLDRKYNRESKKEDIMVEMPEGLDDNRVGKEDSRTSAISIDLRNAIDDLVAENPKDRHIIEAIFMDSDGDLKSKIVYSQIGREIGVKAAQVSRVHKNIVKPFFYKRFKGEIR